jgi:hypothetical protein
LPDCPDLLREKDEAAGMEVRALLRRRTPESGEEGQDLERREKGQRGEGAPAVADVEIWRGGEERRQDGEDRDECLHTEQCRGRGLVFREGSRRV